MVFDPELHRAVLRELNTHVFFTAMLKALRDARLGETKARAILLAIAEGDLRVLPTARQIELYVPPRDRPKLYLLPAVREALARIATCYERPRKLEAPAMPISVTRGTSVYIVSATIGHMTEVATISHSMHKTLHRRLGNSLHYRSFALLVALRLHRCAEVGADIDALIEACKRPLYANIEVDID